MCSFLAVMLVFIPPASASEPATGHPYLLFHDISETPGYQYRTADPWKSWQSSIISGADASLKKDFSGSLGSYDRVSYRGGFAEELGMAYQITKKVQYAQKAKEALLNLSVGTVSDKVDRANALGSYSLAYDFIQPTLSKAEDTVIRDKLATLADTVYKNLNDGGTTRSYIAFYDYHGQAYPMVGIAGAALSDYTNPNKLSLSSLPADWKKAGKEYLFVDDKLHSYGRSLFSFGFDEASGKALNGAYKCYVIDNYPLWFQVSYHAYGENLLELYPAAKKAMMSEVWESLPNDYSSNYVTNGNTLWNYGGGILSLLSSTERAQVLNYLDRIKGKSLLPYSRTFSGGSGVLYYSVYGNYNSVTRKFPTTTSRLDADSIFQVFRGSWKDDSDWLSLVTFNVDSTSNRDTLHHDQLAFEYYSRGDLLLADGGENREVLDMTYGGYDIHHNTIAIENPRSAFPVSPWSGSTSAGIYKGSDNGIVTPVTVGTIIDESWMQLLRATAKVTTVNTRSYGGSQSLSSPIQYERTIMYPENDYFIVIDRMEGTQTWVYRNIFRPTSLVTTPTTSTSDSAVGHVNGALTIGSSSYNWQGLSYATETATGITTNTIGWTTTNPYGKSVKLDIVSAPSSEILVEKNVGRIGGYSYKSEVYNPVVYFRTPARTSEYRVTALLSRYASETAKTANEVAVTGTGHALHVRGSGYDDYIYTGKGTSTFAGFTTDADTVFIRKAGSYVEYTIVNGAVLKESGTNILSLSRKVDYLTLKTEGTSTKFTVDGTSSADIRLANIIPKSVLRDGAVYTNWAIENGSVLKITTDLSEHSFTISTGSSLTISPITNKTVAAKTQLAFPVTVTYTGTGTLQVSAADLPANATFDATSRTFSWVPDTAQAGEYRVTFSATDGTMSDSETANITVTSSSHAPVFAAIPATTAQPGTLVSFTVSATDADGDSLTYSASGIPTNATFDAKNRKFSWVPAANQVGKYTITFRVTDGGLNDEENATICVTNDNRAPVMTPIPAKTVKPGSLLNFTVNATDADGDILTYSAAGLPVNATFNSTSRIFNWVPNATQAGKYNITFRVTDGMLGDEENATVTVTNANQAPVMAKIPAASVKQGNRLAFSVTATDADGDTLTYSATNLPANATFNPASRAFSWVPAAAQAGVHTVTFSVSDGKLKDEENATITVTTTTNHAPVMAKIPAVTATPGKKITFVVTATDADGDTLKYSAAGLPAGATFNSATRAFGWIPTAQQAGTYTVTFRVSDGKLTAEQKATITVSGTTGNHAPVLKPIPAKTIKQGTRVTFMVTATDADRDRLTYTATNLPYGATFNSRSRTFSWSPNSRQVGTFTITFVVSDGKLTDAETAKITVTSIPKVNHAPVMAKIPASYTWQNSKVGFNVVAYDIDRDFLTYTAKNLPAGATFDGKTGSFSWTPDTSQSGVFTVTFTASDGKLSDSKTAAITVYPIKSGDKRSPGSGSGSGRAYIRLE